MIVPVADFPMIWRSSNRIHPRRHPRLDQRPHPLLARRLLPVRRTITMDLAWWRPFNPLANWLYAFGLI